MGRIAPRKRKATGIYQPLLRIWQNLNQRLKPGVIPLTQEQTDSEQPTKNGTRQGIKALLLKIWHLPDGFRWLEPLPYFHRRGVIISGAIMLLALLWPYSPPNDTSSSTQANGQSTPLPLQAEWPSERTNGSEAASQAPRSNQWQRYQIQPGQTLAQLFRDNNLPVNEVFAMAQVEGNDKPLSNLKAGQEVRIERDANGVITALSVTAADNSQATFRRQADGRYQRQR